MRMNPILRKLGRLLDNQFVAGAFRQVFAKALRLLEVSPRLKGLAISSFGSSTLAGGLGASHRASGFRPLHTGTELLLEKLLTHSERTVDIIVPVYNAAQDFRVCLDDVLLTMSEGDRLVIVNDASTDPEIGNILNSIHDTRVTLISNSENLGFTRSVNIGLEATRPSADVVFLNSDTFGFTAGWTRRLQAGAYLSHGVGTVTPWGSGISPFGLDGDLEKLFRELEEDGSRGNLSLEKFLPFSLIPAPTGHGFCLLVRREVLNRLPKLDDSAYPRGYGEENDFCQRALQIGFRNVVFPKVFVQHRGTASFESAEKTSLVKAGLARLDQDHPSYRTQVADFLASGVLTSVNHELAKNLAATKPDFRKRFLLVSGVSSGGTKDFSKILSRALEEDYEVLFASVTSGSITIAGAESNSDFQEENLFQPNDESPTQMSAEFDSVFAAALLRHSIHFVHFEHLSWVSRNAAKVCKGLGIRSAFFAHDYHALCPTVQLIDADGKYCGGLCSTSSASTDCAPQFANGNFTLPLRGKGRQIWMKGSLEFLRDVNSIITSSQVAKEVLDASLNLGSRIKVLSHPLSLIGAELAAVTIAQSTPDQLSEDSILWILVPGNVGRHKGSAIFRGLMEHLETQTQQQVRFLFAGSQDFVVKSPHIAKGHYDAQDLVALVESYRPRVALFLSQWAETYNFTVDDVLMCGLPVASLDIGAEADRLEGQPFFLGVSQENLSDPKTFFERLIEFSLVDYSHSISKWRGEVIREDQVWIRKYKDLVGLE